MRVHFAILLLSLICGTKGAVIYTFSGTTIALGGIPGGRVETFQYSSPGFIGTLTVIPVSKLNSCSGCSAAEGPIVSPHSVDVDQVQFDDSNGAGYIYPFPLGTLGKAGTYQTALPPNSTGPINTGTLTIQVTDALSATNSAGYEFCGYSNNTLCNSISLAPGEDASIFGSDHVANITAQATGDPLPAVLGNYTVTVSDSLGVSRMARLSYVSPLQINFVVPPETALGPATITVAGPGGAQSFAASIANVAPGIFTANGNGTGAPAAQIVRVAADGSQNVEGVITWDANSQQWTAAPIAIGSGAVYLVLYATGVRNHAGPVQAGFYLPSGPVNLPAAYAGPQGQFAGLDQVNVLLPTSLNGAGAFNLFLNVDGAISNVVALAAQ
jgi:uncharacterized protein (TIGR03437 family)